MTIYAIGDIQGCYRPFWRLLDLIDFDPAQDQLWLAGDLVNRGPHSLEVLRFVMSLGDAAVTVLGNHDVHLLVSAWLPHKRKRKDTLLPILQAPDAQELLDWLRTRPLFHFNDQFCMLHAGLPPQWDFNMTRRLAAEAEQALSGEDFLAFFECLYCDQPAVWREDLQGVERLRFTVNCLTRLRYCSAEGELDFHCKTAPGQQPAHLIPWYAVPGRKSLDMRIIFGHWSTLGFFSGYNCFGIDTGCLWGGQLTALALSDSPRRMSLDCEPAQDPAEFD